MNNIIMQHFHNLPEELLTATRWIEVGAFGNPKAPKTKAWTRADKQKLYTELRGNRGFVCSVHPDDRKANPERADYLLIDGDHVFNPDTGEFVNKLAATWCKFVFDALRRLDENFFCERSMSREGFHILARPTVGKFNLAGDDGGTLYFGKHDTDAEKKACPKIELFVGSQGRQVVLTGDLLNCKPAAVIPTGAHVDELLQTLITQIEIQNAQSKQSTNTKKQSTATPPANCKNAFAGFGISQETIDAVNNITPEQIEAAGIVGKAPIGHFICPHCGSGNHGNQSGALAADTNLGFTHWKCYSASCDFDGNNIQLFADVWKLNQQTDFVEILQRACDQFNITFQRHEPPHVDNRPDDTDITTALVTDCPISLHVPAGFVFDRQGIFYTAPPKRRGEEPKLIPVANLPMLPTKAFREHGTNITTYEVAVKKRHKWWTTTFDGKTLQDPRRVLDLANNSASILEPKLLAKFFAYTLADEALPEVTIYTKPGWHGDKFVYPTGGDDYICRRNGINYAELFATKGDPDKWLLKFQFLTTLDNQCPLKRCVIGAAAAAPLLKVLELPNFSLHVEGRLNLAKTPLLKFALSLYGNPTEGKLLRSFDATAKNRQAMAVGLCDLPQGLDELESLSKRDADGLSKSVYDYVTGVVNQANKRDGTVRPAESFRGIRISTGERPLLTDRDKGGALKRLVTLRVEKPLFDEVQARDLHNFCAQNFGHFGRQWIQFIIEHQDDIKTLFYGIIGEIRAAQDFDFEAHLETHIRAVAVCTLATQLLACCLGVNAEDFDNIACRDAISILRDLPTKDDISDLQRGIDRLSSYLDEHPKNFMQETENGDIAPALSYNETSGIIYRDGRVVFFTNAFRRIVEDELQLPSYQKFLNELYDADKIDAPSKREKAKVIRIDNKTARVYMFKSGVLKADTEAADLADEYETITSND